MNNVISLSGGKDSTCCLLLMLEKREPIHSVVFFDTGWEFSSIHEHINKLEQYVEFKFVRLYPSESFYYRLIQKPVISRKGESKGQIHRTGSGWPSAWRRWCTREKVHTINKYIRQVPDAVQCIGYAVDETHRTSRKLQSSQFTYRYPLQEYGITEQQALAYCMSRGFDWDGLYRIFNRVSCFCCPLQGFSELRKLRKYYPDLWNTMLKWDREIPDNRGFKGYKTVNDLEARFKAEEMQLSLPGL